jgi:hypothetical protein
MSKKIAAAKDTLTLGVGERFTLISILPQQGPIAVVRMVESLAKRLVLTVEEQGQCELTPTDEGGIKWNKPVSAEIEFSPWEKDLVVRELKKLSEGEKLTVQMIPLWDLFVGE